jgi:tetratricopeptide (TPR) repeat protein
MPNKIEPLKKQIEHFFEEKKFKKIIDLLTNDTLEQYSDADLYAWKARALFRNKGDENEILLFAQKAIQTDGNGWLGYIARGCAWGYKKEYDKAILDYNKAIELNPDNAISYNNRGNIWDKQKEYDKAIQDYSKAIELNPGDAITYYNRGNIWDKQKEYDKAIQDYSKAIELNPMYADAFCNRGNTWSNKKEYLKALHDYNKAIKLNPHDATALNNRGNSWDKEKEHHKAIQDYNKAIELNSNYAAAYYNRANSWIKEKEYDKAIQDYNKTIEISPDFGAAYFNLALTYETKKKLDLSLAFFTKAKESNHRVEHAESKIKDIQERIAANLASDLSNSILKIKSIVSAIRTKSLAGSEVARVVHYSKLPVADIITKDCHSRLHYSNVIYMNDPQEGKIFVEYLNDKEITDWLEKSSYKNESTIFLGSFLPANEGDENDDNAEDQLLMWRTYGKNEHGLDAAGCNLVIDAAFFDSGEKKAEDIPTTFAEIKKAIEDGFRFTEDNRNSLLKVQYIRKGKIKGDENGILKKLVDYLKDEIKSLIEKIGDDSTALEGKLYTESKIFDALQEVCHLFKSADYAFEKEVRIIRTEPRCSNNIEYYKNAENKEPMPPRHFYIKSEKRILPYLKKIHLGPKVKDATHWSLHLDYSLRKAAETEEEEIKELSNLAGTFNVEENLRLANLNKFFAGREISSELIKPNEIEIIPSKCRFI